MSAYNPLNIPLDKIPAEKLRYFVPPVCNGKQRRAPVTMRRTASSSTASAASSAVTSSSTSTISAAASPAVTHATDSDDRTAGGGIGSRGSSHTSSHPITDITANVVRVINDRAWIAMNTFFHTVNKSPTTEQLIELLDQLVLLDNTLTIERLRDTFRQKRNYERRKAKRQPTKERVAAERLAQTASNIRLTNMRAVLANSESNDDPDNTVLVAEPPQSPPSDPEW